MVMMMMMMMMMRSSKVYQSSPSCQGQKQFWELMTD
jgi:hypothetical protein